MVVGNSMDLGIFEIQNIRTLKQFPKTQLIIVKLPKEIAKYAIGIRIQIPKITEPMDVYHQPPLADEAIVCRCERVTAGEIRKWIRKGVVDQNQLKAITRAGAGACGGKSCNNLIKRLYREEGIENFYQATIRPLFIEVPLGIFASKKKKEE